SSGASRVKCSYQFLSVTPTQIFIGHFFQVTTSVRGRHSNVGAKKGRLASLQALEILVAGEDLNLRPTLAIPDFRSLMLPAVALLGQASPRSTGEVRDAPAREFELTPEDLTQMLPSGKQRTYIANSSACHEKSLSRQARHLGQKVGFWTANLRRHGLSSTR